MTTFPAAVVFDLDGTLIDSEQTWDEVRRGLAAEDGVPWPDEATTAMMGMSTQEWSTYLSETVGLTSDPDQSARRVIDALLDRYRHGRIEVLPGAADAVRRLAAEFPLGVASSSARVLIEAGLDAIGVRDAVSVVVSTEEVANGKPEPDGYLEACRQLGVDPAASVAVEDSGNGAKSALAAGMKTVVIPPAFHPPSDDILQRCDAVLDGLADLTPDLVRSLFD
ncbi:HAD family hydrolase [Nigerium massiliense]|uniref:HAD family hydrolase n=1 Tax=Nigerium massiliense TaxID=1522317 RepID=UPI00058F1A63|nr:HAD family phosphatase [Nigerium massiliense]